MEGSRPAGERGPAGAARATPETKDYPKVEMYGTSWCPSCKKAKAHLRARGVPFDEYDVEKDAAARQRQKAIEPSGAVPTAVIGGAVLVGFSADAFDAALDSRR